MKLSVSNYSYYQAIKKGELTPLGTIAKTKELGFEAVEIVDFISFPMDKRNEWKEIAKEIKAEADKIGIEISALTVGADLLKNPEEDMKKLKEFVDIGEILGVKFMRHDATVGFPKNSENYCSFDSVVDTLADRFREITEYAEAKGIKTMTENHGQFSQDSDRVEKLYNTINHPNFGLLVDIGNFMCADENPALAVSKVAPYAIYVHAKDFIMKPFYSENPGEGSFTTRAGNYLRGTIIGHGNMPVKQCLSLLKNCGYNGYIAVEFEGMEPCFDGIRIGGDNVKKYWDEV